MARINNIWYGEFYAPVNSESREIREDFYAYAAASIKKMRDSDATIPMILLGDFNGHIIGHYSTSTNSNGKLIQKMERDQCVQVLNLNAPTWTQGERRTCVDYVAANKKGIDMIISARVNDEDYTTSDHDRIEIVTRQHLLVLENPRNQIPRCIPVYKLKDDRRRELYVNTLDKLWNKYKDVEDADPDK